MPGTMPTVRTMFLRGINMFMPFETRNIIGEPTIFTECGPGVPALAGSLSHLQMVLTQPPLFSLRTKLPLEISPLLRVLPQSRSSVLGDIYTG